MSLPPPMHERYAGQLVIAECLRVQSLVAQRTRWHRLLGTSPLSVESHAWYQGALGEIAVGQILATLPPGWAVIHALPIGANGADIDHLVVGPGGIFTINTKHHIGKNLWIAERTFMVNGYKVSYLRNAEYEADRVHALLSRHTQSSFTVYPIIAVVDARRITVRSRPRRVRVVDAHRLRRLLTKATAVLDADKVTEIVDLLDRPTTWPAEPTTNPRDTLAQFHSLRTAVQAARARNRLWRLGLALIPFLGIGYVIWAMAAFLPIR